MRFLSIALIAVVLFSCVEAPEFPNTPKIEFNRVIFKDLGSGQADSLIVFVDFEDGDGDLGLDASEIAAPFNQQNYFNNKNGQVLPVPTNRITEQELAIFADNLMTFSDRAAIDSLPDYSGNAICLNWDTTTEIEIPVTLNDGSLATAVFSADTIYYQINERHYNFLIEYFIDRGSGFELFDWRLEIDCSTDFNGRFPILNPESNDKALEGTIKYGMTSVGFNPLFGDSQLKLRMTILDRAGNYSNTIETPPFRLSEID